MISVLLRLAFAIMMVAGPLFFLVLFLIHYKPLVLRGIHAPSVAALLCALGFGASLTTLLLTIKALLAAKRGKFYELALRMSWAFSTAFALTMLIVLVRWTIS